MSHEKASILSSGQGIASFLFTQSVLIGGFALPPILVLLL